MLRLGGLVTMTLAFVAASPPTPLAAGVALLAAVCLARQPP